MNHIIWNQNKVNIDDVFAYNIAKDVIKWGSRTNDNWRLSIKKWLAKMERFNLSRIRFAC